MAGTGLEQIAPNLLLFLVLQEYPPDVPTLNTENASSGCALGLNLQRMFLRYSAYFFL